MPEEQMLWVSIILEKEAIACGHAGTHMNEAKSREPIYGDPCPLCHMSLDIIRIGLVVP